MNRDKSKSANKKKKRKKNGSRVAHPSALSKPKVGRRRGTSGESQAGSLESIKYEQEFTLDGSRAKEQKHSRGVKVANKW